MISNATLDGSDASLSLRGPSSTIEGASITSVSSSAIALDVLDGHHDWKDVTVSKTYTSQDTTSIGLKAWYSTIVAEDISIANHGNGIQLSNAMLNGNSMTVVDGKSTGIVLEDSHLGVESLTTQVFPTGAHLEGTSTLQASNWAASLHGTPLMIGSESTATVRDFQPQNTQVTSSDALGDGYLLYGGSTSASIATSSSDFLEETPVTFTDLTGSPIEAEITVHGFTLQSNSNGAATLPLKSQGSVVDVSLGGAGVRVTLYGATMGQSVQVPVIPQGDWTITSGQFVYLGARPDGTPHMIDGDLTLETGSGLQLASTAVILPSDGTVNVQGSAQLLGDASSITAQSFTMGFDSILSSGSADAFTVNGNVSWACQTLRTSEGVEINGNLALQPGCKPVSYTHLTLPTKA